MRSVIEAAIVHFQKFTENGIYLGLFFMAVLYLMAEKKEQENRKLFCGYTIVFAVLYWFPITAYIIMKYCIGELVYWRMFWILPIWIVIAYVLVEWQWKIEKKSLQYLFFSIAAGVLIFCGKPVYNSANFQKAENAYKIPQIVIELCDAIEADAKEAGIEEIKAVVPIEWITQIRQYDAAIGMPYGRNAVKREKMNKRDTYIFETIVSSNYEWERFAQALKEEKCNYYICQANFEASKEIEKYGFKETTEIGSYKIYRLE